jgi:hypothetical protein
VCETINGQKCIASVNTMEFKWHVQQNSNGQYVGCDQWHHSSNVVS